MADTRSTLLECSVKVRLGRKWKSRWCVMTRQSPVSAEVILKFYKDQSALVTNKELSRERVCISADRYCGLEYGFRHPKNIYVLTVVLSTAVVLLSFPSNERLLEWYHRIKNTLPSATEFRSRVSIPNKGKLPSGRSALYFYNDHFAITPETPLRLIAAWDLSKVYRYGVFPGGFAFSVISSKGSVNHILLLPNPEYIKNQFDAAMSVHLPSRWSTHSDLNPADRDPYQGATASTASYLLHREQENVRNETTERTVEREGEGPVETDHLLSNTDSADSNCNTQKCSDMRVGDGALEDIELGTMATCLRNSQSDLSVGSMHETVFGNAVPLCPPQSTPFREQEYEVMASFDHYRISLHEDVDLGSLLHLSHEKEYHPLSSSKQLHSVARAGSGPSRGAIDFASMSRFRLDHNSDVRDYVNLPSPKSTYRRENTIHNSLRRSKPPSLYTRLPQEKVNIDNFNLSPPSSPPPPPPVHCSHTGSLIHSKETISLQRLASDENTRHKDLSGLVSSQFPAVNAPIPFDHEELVKPGGPVARLKRNSQDSENSYLPSGSEYGDSSHYSSAASSRHNSFDRDTFQRPPPVPPKSADRKVPLIKALLSSENYRSTTTTIFDTLPSSTAAFSGGSVPPIPPKPDNLRGRPLLKERSSPSSPRVVPHSARKRCNTVPSFAAMNGDTEWLDPQEGEEGYLIMKPAAEDTPRVVHARSKSVPDEECVHVSPAHSLPPTLPRSWTTSSGTASLPRAPHAPFGSPSFHDPSGAGSSFVQCIPQSPIHGPDNNLQVRTLKRSATIGVFQRRTSRSPSFTGKRPSLVRRTSRQRRSSESTSTSLTSDISLSSIPKPTHRRQDKYGSLNHDSLRSEDFRSEDLSQDIAEDFSQGIPEDFSHDIPESPTTTTTLTEDMPCFKDEFDEKLPLSSATSLNSSPRVSPASSEDDLQS